ncbi:hypothetical protein A4R35_00210 [Thermogemmatispora tikiterensis]|uniref:Uncharacterized protein n=1 Tax=Thermogemmatispora tikiterensis TaxID=1825093 RepID=A0A328VEH2_9CHLR|nr:hypothetical protein A4R35_00210 [Thermogemmatispora tikiterensis]
MTISLLEQLLNSITIAPNHILRGKLVARGVVERMQQRSLTIRDLLSECSPKAMCSICKIAISSIGPKIFQQRATAQATARSS